MREGGRVPPRRSRQPSGNGEIMRSKQLHFFFIDPMASVLQCFSIVFIFFIFFSMPAFFMQSAIIGSAFIASSARLIEIAPVAKDSAMTPAARPLLKLVIVLFPFWMSQDPPHLCGGGTPARALLETPARWPATSRSSRRRQARLQPHHFVMAACAVLA